MRRINFLLIALEFPERNKAGETVWRDSFGRRGEFPARRLGIGAINLRQQSAPYVFAVVKI